MKMRSVCRAWRYTYKCEITLSGTDSENSCAHAFWERYVETKRATVNANSALATTRKANTTQLRNARNEQMTRCAQHENGTVRVANTRAEVVTHNNRAAIDTRLRQGDATPRPTIFGTR